MKQKVLVEGDPNLLVQNEILVETSEGYTVLRERLANNSIKTFIVVPLEEFISKKEDEKDH